MQATSFRSYIVTINNLNSFDQGNYSLFVNSRSVEMQVKWAKSFLHFRKPCLAMVAYSSVVQLLSTIHVTTPTKFTADAWPWYALNRMKRSGVFSLVLSSPRLCCRHPVIN